MRHVEELGQCRERARQQAPWPRRESVRRAVKQLQDCSISAKLLYTAFLLLMGVGYLMALTYLYLTHQGLVGKPGLSVTGVGQAITGIAAERVWRRRSLPISRPGS